MAATTSRVEALARLRTVAASLTRAAQIEMAIDLKLRPLRVQMVEATAADSVCVNHISTDLLAVLTEDVHTDIESNVTAADATTWQVLELWKEELRRRIFEHPLDSPADTVYEALRKEYVGEHTKLEKLLASRVRLLTERSELTASLDHATASETIDDFTVLSGDVPLTTSSFDDFQLLSDGSFPMLRPHYFWPELTPSLWKCFREALERAPVPGPDSPRKSSEGDLESTLLARQASQRSVGDATRSVAEATNRRSFPPRVASDRRRPALSLHLAGLADELVTDTASLVDVSLPELLGTLTGAELESSLREHVFYGGVSHELRPEVWKYLCNYYPDWFARPHQREEIDRKKHADFEALKATCDRLLSSVGVEQAAGEGATPEFLTDMRKKIDKDVIRTDQESLFFRGSGNPNVQRLRTALLCYVVHDPAIGYVQGMSDLMAPFLAAMSDDADAFWCFVAFMESTMRPNFENDQYAIRRQMATIHSLLQIVDPQLLAHCERLDSGDLVFCFRWLVLYFKREFSFTDVLRLWEILWSNHLAAQFHVFIALAMLHLMRNEILTKARSNHELLGIINNMSEQLDLDEVRYRAELLFARVMAIWSSPDAMDAAVANTTHTPNIFVD